MTLFHIIIETLLGIAAFPVILLIIRDTCRGDGKWGINFRPRSCPRCRSLLPRIRRPKNELQRLFGGSTCPSCGFESDKWGQPPTPINLNEDEAKFLQLSAADVAAINEAESQASRGEGLSLDEFKGEMAKRFAVR